jgi:hypothetical protein
MYIQELRAKRRIRELRQSGSDKVEEYIDAFDQEISSKNEEIRRLDHEINRLKYGTFNEVSSSPGPGRSLLLSAREAELYQGERLSIVLDAVANASGAAEPNSRRQAVLDDLIVANSQESEREEILAPLKGALRSYTSMSGKTRADFEWLGFEVREDGKHYKLIFRGDDRFPVILPKTSGDYRAGLNAFADLKRKLF